MISENYYKEMIKRDRSFSIFSKGKLKCFITYFIGGGDVKKYVRNNSWSIVDDEPKTGNVCYLDQCFTDKKVENYRYIRFGLDAFMKFIKEKYPQVNNLRWNRFKDGAVKVYRKELI